METSCDTHRIIVYFSVNCIVRIEDILNKNEVTEDEMTFVIEQFIFVKKNVSVTINVKSFSFSPFLYRNEIKKLTVAYEIARNYFLNEAVETETKPV